MINKTFTTKEAPGVQIHDEFPHSQSCYPLLGRSVFIQRIRQQIHFASEVNYPVFISGEPGCEKKDIARMIHKNSPRCTSHFVCIPANVYDLNTYRGKVMACIKLARGGTVYFEEIDSLSPMVKDELIFLFSTDIIQEQLRKYQIRLIISCTEPLDTVSMPPQFLSKLLGPSVLQLNFHLPPLREREQDIEQHIDFILGSLNKSIQLTPEARYLINHYDWPGNIDQLQHSLLSLASLSEKEITKEDIINYCVDIVQDQKENLIDCLMDQQIDVFQRHHPALYKALVFLSANYRENITLTQVAEASFTSASHLSYLFRKHIGYSFKTILGQVRVRFAQQQMAFNPHLKITDVCLSSGFGDLSHFEKMFKRYIGCTPRQYRSQQRDPIRHLA